MADRQHSYAQHRKESGRQRADELQKSEVEWEKDEQFILDMEKEVEKKHQASMLNQVNPEEVANELQTAEKGIERGKSHADQMNQRFSGLFRGAEGRREERSEATECGAGRAQCM